MNELDEFPLLTILLAALVIIVPTGLIAYWSYTHMYSYGAFMSIILAFVFIGSAAVAASGVIGFILYTISRLFN